ncbi:MAG: hypothetical protein U0992_21535 [Planctomycetaceae bacterium]
MTVSRRVQYCRHCRCHSLFGWVEPKHTMYSAFTVAMIGTSYLTPATGVILLALWAQRIAATRYWACPHCCEGVEETALAA